MELIPNKTSYYQTTCINNENYDFRLGWSVRTKRPARGSKNRGIVNFSMKEKTRDNRVDLYSNDDSDSTLAGHTLSGSRYECFTGNSEYILLDPSNIRSLFVSDFSLLKYEAEDSDEGTIAKDYTSNEDILAAYAMVEMKSGTWPYSGGFRYEQTDFETCGYEFLLDEDEEPSYNAMSSSNNDSDLLLSLNSRYDINKNPIMRASISNTIARPKFGDSAITTARSIADEDIVRGNPNLNPYESTKFDISIERYKETFGLFSTNMFYKDISSLIFAEESHGVTNELRMLLNGNDKFPGVQ